MHILKKYNNSKGILIITHKERDFLLKSLSKYCKFYYIFVHNGSIHEPVFNKFITYNMVTNSRCVNKKCIPYTSRNFLNKHFNNNGLLEETNKKLLEILTKYNLLGNFDFKLYGKNFDFICVNRSAAIKENFELLVSVTEFAKKYSELKICFVTISDALEDSYHKRMVNFSKNNHFDNLLFINGCNLNLEIIDNPFKVFTREELSYFYKSSKIYIHYTEGEGESRTIHEALCCGCKILAKKNMRGGGLDNLNNKNSLLYNKSNYIEKMKEIQESYIKYEYDIELFKTLNETFSVDKFLNFLFESLKFENINFEEFSSQCDTENLMNKLPAHDISVPWFIEGKCTSDVLSLNQISIVKKYL